MFDEAFLDDLPSDPYEAVQVMYEKFKEVDSAIPLNKRNGNFNKFIDAFAAMEAFINATGLDFASPKLSTPPRPNKDIVIIRKYFYSLNSRVSAKLSERKVKSYFDKSREKYAMRFGAVFAYQFSDGDISRIQELLNELRDTITKSELFEAKHKQRILKKLEKLQGELHKKMSNLDGFLGLIGDAGVVLGKFGKDAKPLVDRILEIEGIIWRTLARAEELPSGTTLPLLSDGKPEDE